MSWQQAIRAGSCDCIHRFKRADAARRWFRVDTLLCCWPRASQEPGDRGGVDAVEGELFGREDLSSLAKDVQQLNVSHRRDVLGEQPRSPARCAVRSDAGRPRSHSPAAALLDRRDDVPTGRVELGRDMG